MLVDNSFREAYNTYLGNVTEQERQLFAKDFEEMQQYASELYPNDPAKKDTLHEGRARDLENRIKGIFQKIEKWRNPVRVFTSQEVLIQQLESIESLKNIVNQCTPTEFHKKLKGMNPELKGKIYQLVWLASGCPRGSRFSENLLKKDTGILKQLFFSLLGGREGTLLDQVAEELQRDFSLSQNLGDASACIENKVNFFLQKLEDLKITSQQMKGLFNLMPLGVQNQLKTMGIEPPFYGRGADFKAYKFFGAHYDPLANMGRGKTTFRVYAPNAERVVVNLTYNRRVQHEIVMQKGKGGIWTAETCDAPPKRTYHFMITGSAPGAEPVKKVDPFAFHTLIHNLEGKRGQEGKRNKHESVVIDSSKEFPWTDGVWMQKRQTPEFSKQPLVISELHAPSWKLSKEGKALTWSQLADPLLKYCQEMGYNAIELMGWTAHPQPCSMGYQVTNFFAPHAEMGSPEELKSFVNLFHAQGIRIFLDWVPAHFANDSFGLRRFDGSALYEDDDPGFAEHPKWGSIKFCYEEKKFTNTFLLSNLCYWLEEFHVDGIRVDAVSSMLYFNYDRPDDAPKRFNQCVSEGKREQDFDAKRFLRNANTYVHQNFSGVTMMAEESSVFANITRSPNERGEDDLRKGLGFDRKWHMSRTGDIRKYLKDPVNFELFKHSLKDCYHCNDANKPGTLVNYWSHDENVHGNGTLLMRAPGDNLEKKMPFARAISSYLKFCGEWGYLEFAGTEFLQSQEWHAIVVENPKKPIKERTSSVEWDKLNPSIYPRESRFHLGAQKASRDANHLIHKMPGLRDPTAQGMKPNWTDDKTNHILSFHRAGGGQQLLFVINLSEIDFLEYDLELKYDHAPESAHLKGVEEIYNTDNIQYAGQGRLNSRSIAVLHDDGRTHVRLRIPSHTAMLFEEKF